jgi:hypothetical protein
MPGSLRKNCRRDEIGDIAKRPKSSNQRDRGRAPQGCARRSGGAGADQRKRDMVNLADGFERAVREIVEMVGSASTELEASSSTLATTAPRAQELTSVSVRVGRSHQQRAVGCDRYGGAVLLGQRDQPRGAGIRTDGGRCRHPARTTTGRVSELSVAATRICDFVELINTIAGQTNLLGLAERAAGRPRHPAGAAETGPASSQVLSSNRLKDEVGKFLRTVRAA